MFQVDIVEKPSVTTSRFFLVKDFFVMLTYIVDYLKLYPTRIRVKIF